MRNVAGMLDVDQIIEDTAALDRVSGQIDAVAARWGVRVEMVKVQRVEAGPLKAVLEKKKNADLTNKEMIIQAKAKKQTTVIESEGHRDRMIREAEGNAAQTISVGACVRIGNIPGRWPPSCLSIFGRKGLVCNSKAFGTALVCMWDGALTKSKLANSVARTHSLTHSFIHSQHAVKRRPSSTTPPPRLPTSRR